ncbi:MFS transporter [Paludibacterium sp.]|uniref:MFS transporter n=1 Tax=Paludibacterium sp. TaxID=1917523 RepID=UPI0025EB5699|nr:MFS transporter [Paludibacterium sp.]MBV8647591.1 MFS transporter [Paludibacterium sp.]
MNPQRKNTLIIYGASYFWSLTTLMVMSTLTIYHEHVLGISKMHLGSIQAYAVLSMYGTKMISGILIDIFKNYKMVLIFGSILSMIARPMFAFVSGPFSIFLLRSFERLTKGVRAGPADAFLTINQQQENIGQAVAYKQVSYTLGAMSGALTASVFLYFYPDHFAMLYKLSIIPGLLATILLFYIEPIPFTEKKSTNRFQWEQIKNFPGVLYFMYFLAFAVTAARFGENFVGHRFYEYGAPTPFLPLVYIIYDLPWCLISFFLAKRLDQHDFKKTLLFGLVFLFSANILLLSSNHLIGLIAGTICAGVYAATVQGILTTAIAKMTQKDVRGTAFAIYYVVVGLGFFTSFKLTGYFAHAFNTWRMGFFGQTIISFLLILLVLLLPKRFFKD